MLQIFINVRTPEQTLLAQQGSVGEATAIFINDNTKFSDMPSSFQGNDLYISAGVLNQQLEGISKKTSDTSVLILSDAYKLSCSRRCPVISTSLSDCLFIWNTIGTN